MSEPESLENAREIIERFGGIRPMSTKTDIPVTTIQGWKKRDTIPGSRVDAVLAAASENNINLDDLMSEQKASTSQTDLDASKETAGDTAQVGAHTEYDDGSSSEARFVPPPVSERQATPYGQGQPQNSGKLVFVGLIVLIAFLVAGLMTLAPKVKVVTEQADRIVSLERKLETVEAEQAEISETVPTNLQVKLADIQQQANQAVQKAQSVASQASGSFNTAIDTSSLENRLGTLETSLETFLEQKGSLDLAGLWTNFLGLRATTQGRTQLDSASTELLSWINRLQSDEVTLDEALPVIREESDTVGKTFDGVEDQDLKAAAMLLAMSQMRDTLRRDRESFDTDLNLLRKLVGSENPALMASIDKLAPHADEGVLSPTGLKNEFRGLAGDVVTASLEGEDVSITDKAKARFGDILKVEKDGEQLTGTPTQITVAKAQKKLDEGDIQGAIGLLQGLDGKAGATAKPFIEEAQLTLLAKQIQDLLGQSIETQLRVSNDKMPSVSEILEGRSLPNLPKSIDPKEVLDGIKEAVPLKGEVKEDPNSGFKIYKKNALEN